MTAGQRLWGNQASIARLSAAIALPLLLWCGYLWLMRAPAEHGPEERATISSGASGNTVSPVAARQRQAGDAAAAPTTAFHQPRTSLPEPRSAAGKGLEGLGLSEDYLDAAVNDYARRQVREAQDRIMSQWPGYAEVRDQYVRELSSVLDLEHLSGAKMIELATALRQDFWAQGGDMAVHSYPSAYKARALLEQAHQRFPNNLDILDELIETIQSTDLVLKCDPVEKCDRPNEAVRQELQSLRQQQWALVQSERQAGRAPCMQDFVCGCDLAYLLQARNAPASKQIVRWLREADDGTWRQYEELLQRWEEHLDRGFHFGFGIYRTSDRPGRDQHRYGRRLPSFRGPTDRQASFWPTGEMMVIETVETPARL
jgi:hypothetical protein